MNSLLIDTWIRLRASYWFLPSIISISAVATAVVAVQLDLHFGNNWVRNYPWLLANQPAGARDLLSTLAASAITVAGVTFSMTLLAVSHASAQIGPRLLFDFMRDRGNQFTLGVFIATFLYCLIVLRTVQAGVAGDEINMAFVPHIAITVAVALAFLNVIVFIFFIHHVPRSISVTSVIARVGDELANTVQTIYPELLGSGSAGNTPGDEPAVDFEHNSVDLPVSASAGYFRVLDFEGLLAITKEHDLVVELKLAPGNFALQGQTLMRAGPAQKMNSDIEHELHSAISWGTERTREQDVLFLVEQLIEILGKAMSPGVNGQYTALLCVNQFERALAEILSRKEPDSKRYDDEGELRVIAAPVSHKEFLLAIILPVRQFVRGDWIVSSRVVEMMKRLSQLPELSESKALLDEVSALINDDIDSGPMAESEKLLLLGKRGIRSI
ncbi:MAG: DUF2254 domain-containing protein [Xanthomonadales bacterium]|nr:DUF2254 domain-containing protein [Xanthomonadales bacterium]